jgi:hypothetical protein
VLARHPATYLPPDRPKPRDRTVGVACQAHSMPKTQYFTATSLDGFIADADNSLD